MTEQNEKRPRSREVKGSNSFIYIIGTILILLVIGSYFFVRQQKGAVDHSLTTVTPTIAKYQANKTTPDAPASSSTAITTKQPLPAEHTSTKSPESKTNITISQATEINSGHTEQQLAISDQYYLLINKLNAFYTQLDQRDYMQAFALQETSKIHFSKLLQKLIDSPPMVIRETDDLYTLLKNTAHFFRVLGDTNITILKNILDREKDSLEPILKDFYELTLRPKYLEQEYALIIPFDALYDYAGFFLHTMGGRLYLFRRASIPRMVISYYAVLIIDRANREDNNRHGIDLRPTIDSLIKEIEDTGDILQLKEVYLDILYDLKEKYDR